jgi:D-inositol-3-phosphate glycosyltransferase
MRILMVTELYPPHIGGVEVVFKELSHRFAKKGHAVTIITSRLKNTRKVEKNKNLGIIRVWTPNFMQRYFFTLFSIPAILKNARRADVIQTTTYNSAFPAWLAAKLLKKKCVLMVHEVWIGKWSKLGEMNKISAFIHDFLEKCILKLKFDKYVCVSCATAKDLRRQGIASDKIEVIYNGIDYDLFTPNENATVTASIKDQLSLNDSFIYTFFGRPGVSKGLEYLIRAVPFIAEKIPKSKLLLIVSKTGQSKNRFDYMLHLIEKLNIKNHVKTISPVPREKLPDYLKASDCVVVPSLAEGFGFCAAEACACGAPVVVTETGSLPEVANGKVAFVSPKDEESIANAVIKICDGEHTKISEKNFNWDLSAQKYIQLYENLKNA